MLLPFIAVVTLGQQVQKVDWITVPLEGAGVSAEFPGKPHPLPAVVGRSSRNPEGTPARLLGFELIRGFSGFVLVQTDLKVEEKPETFLPKAWDEHIAQKKHFVQIEKEFKQWKGYPTVEGIYQIGSKVKARVRLFVIGQRLFQQAGTWTTGADRDETVDRFFSSLKIE